MGSLATLWPLYPEKETPYALYRILTGPQARLNGWGKIHPNGIQSPDRPVAIPTELSPLTNLYCCNYKNLLTDDSLWV